FPLVIDSVPIDHDPETDHTTRTLTEQDPIPANLIRSIRWLSKPLKFGSDNG
ncbi:hypothetical protein CROQUDRAFT_24226, partial [Cronartium quercuum f. sp. fusiforme G11]